MDYFREAVIPEGAEGIRPDIAKLINKDVENYREFMVKKYNGNEEKAADEFCFRKFLNEYSIAINVFSLHDEYDCKGSFNRYINACWQFLKK